jgi:HEPN domain-containing protein
MRRCPRGAFLSTPEGRARAQVFARKAETDAKALRRLASDPEIDDEPVGFHAQQAIEKWLKAVLVFNGVRFKWRHDLGRLVELLAEGDLGRPPGADWLDELTIYAVPMRYDELLDVEPLDRDSVVALVAAVGTWASDRL